MFNSTDEAPFLVFAGVLFIEPDQPGEFGDRSMVVVFVGREERQLNVGIWYTGRASGLINRYL